MTDWLNRCHFGDVRVVLGRMIADGVKVNCIVTSPPYWALRSYLPADHPDKAHELGSEPTLREFIQTMAGVFDLAREVLTDDGVLFLNMGDSYVGDRGPAWGTSPSSKEARAMTESNRRDRIDVPRSDVCVDGLKPKDMCGQPWRLALELQDRGWWLRQDLIWHKLSPMPETLTDRWTKAHEYVFLLAKSGRYHCDMKAIKEPSSSGTNPRRAKHTGVGFGHGFDPVQKPRYADHGPTPAGWATGAGVKHNAAAHQTIGAHKKTAKYGELTGGNEDGLHRTKAHLKAKLPPKTVLATAGNDGAYADGASGRMGREAGWRNKNNESFESHMNEVVATRNPRSVRSIEETDEELFAQFLAWKDLIQPSVHTHSSQPFKGAHFATYPKKLIRPFIQAGCPPGGTVLDLFLGSGTTAEVAEEEGRNWIGIDLDQRNEALQQTRLAPVREAKRQIPLLETP